VVLAYRSASEESSVYVQVKSSNISWAYVFLSPRETEECKKKNRVPQAIDVGPFA